MYVIQDSDSRLYPADRCTFVTTYVESTKQYEISVTAANRAVFYPGNAAAIQLSANASERPRLGYIAKTGRFVPITGE